MDEIETKVYFGIAPAAPSELVLNPGFETAGAGGADVFGSWNEAAGGGTLAAVTATELVINPGFETAGAGGADVFGTWVEHYSSSSTITDETVDVYEGGHAAKLKNVNDPLLYITQTIAVTPGHAYRLSVWTHGDGSQSGRYSIYDVTNDFDIVAFPTTVGVIGTSYELFTDDFTAPAGCVSVAISFAAPGGAGKTAYFDSASLIDVSNDEVHTGNYACKLIHVANPDPYLYQTIAV